VTTYSLSAEVDCGTAMARPSRSRRAVPRRSGPTWRSRGRPMRISRIGLSSRESPSPGRSAGGSTRKAMSLGRSSWSAPRLTPPARTWAAPARPPHGRRSSAR